MDEEIRNLLAKELKGEIEGLGDFDLGSKELAEAIENVAVLYRLKIDEEKLVLEADEKSETRNSEEQLRQEEMQERVKDRYFRIGLEAAGIVLPLIFYAAWMKKGFKFEETGTFTSTTFRGLFQKFKTTKK